MFSLIFLPTNPYTIQPLKKLFTTLSKKCDFIRPHLLRHAHASSLINAGWDMSLVQQRLVHASIQTTINTYTHIDNKAIKQAFKHYISTQENSQCQQ